MKTLMVIVMAMVMATGVLYGEATGQAPPVPSEEQPEVLTRGPVNEAFAQPVNLEDQTGLIAPIEPPASIEEVPPAEKPAGEEFAWVPGYWAWDSERNGYIWVSGCWRAVPPGMSWVPGYWAKVAGGWQWVAGFWAPVSNNEIEYLPAPPALTDVEPPGPAPSPDRIWVPPCWYWYQGQYIQRRGYWIGAQADWVWVPSHYVWTPRGYVFVNGHWDYALGRRGVLFAPVYFPRHIYERPGFSYGLSIAVDIGNLEFGLFTRPRYSHYYFGDYYDSAYIGIGIFPWYESERRHTWYDPIYVHDRWRHHRNEPRWEERERQEYERRRADKALRPPRTYREMERRVSKMPTSQRRNFEVAAPMTRIVARKTTTFKFEQVKPGARQQISQHAGDVHKFVKERSHWESQGTVRKAGQPAVKRVPSARSEERAPSMNRKGREMRPSEQRESAPAKRAVRGQALGSSREGSTMTREQQRPTKVSQRKGEQIQSDKVKVRTPPVVGKKGKGLPRKKPPSRPTEEQNSPR
jgi:WXXGXW repeat (2 copies)